MSSPEQKLFADGLSVAYGHIQAVRDVSLEVRPGRLLALLGHNGAGKSSLVKALVGVVHQKRGTIWLDGQDVTRMSTAERLASGLCLVPEGRRPFQAESVLDNLLLGGHLRRHAAVLRQQIDELVDKVPVLRDHLDRPAGLLSGGQQQLVAIMRGLMSGPRYLLLDEPFAGLSPRARGEVAALIRDIAASGTGVVLVEQLAAAALHVADRVIVMHEGRLVLQEDAAKLGEGEAIYQAYLGNVPSTTSMEKNRV